MNCNSWWGIVILNSVTHISTKNSHKTDTSWSSCPKTGKHLISKGEKFLEPSSRKTGPVGSAPIWLLILTMGCGAVGLTIISPSLKSVAEEFDVDSATAQFLLSGYFIAIASSQLIYGPMSDRYGRRKPLLIGMGLYAMGGILGVYAASITTLIYARILQGLGAAATVSIVRAIINDSYDRTKGCLTVKN